MVILHSTFLLSLFILPIGSQEIDDPDGNEIYNYRNSSSNSGQNTNDIAASDSNVVFVAFNRKNPNGTIITLDSTESELKSILLENRTTKIITHGWLGSEDGPYLADIRIAYLKKHDLNVIVVGWGRIARNEYAIATLGVAGVGSTVAKMVSNLLDIGLVGSDGIHLVGHSLGAHVMGVVGNSIIESGREKIGRITGLDPAKPGYENIRGEDLRLDSGDGRFVDVIHTSIGVFGYVGPLGHADFYPNGGYNNQPGCPIYRIFCSHLKALEYFIESIENELAFPSVKCDSFSNFESNRCESNEVVYMGEPTPPSTRGIFYLRTSNN